MSFVQIRVFQKTTGSCANAAKPVYIMRLMLRLVRRGINHRTVNERAIGRVSYLIYVSMRHHVLTTSGDIVVCFHTAVSLSC